ncbi:hypothetical protein sos41_01160 [Alphaproteobacteria bacterium SO-S41]|nr:hypothetical protein sos41_01160 [Alphaproteobacteria bacterium SO-S41]
MLKRLLLAATAAAAILALPAAANDGFAGITATGLEFSKTDDIAMQSEDLKIGIDQISVDYVFKNTSAADVSGTIAFPMPPIAVSLFTFSPTNMKPADLDKENPLDFTATVDGKPVALKTDRRAYAPIPEPEQADPNAPYVPPPASKEYDAPGEDITELLTGMGVPLSLDPETVMAALDKLPADKIKILTDKGLVQKDEEASNGPEMRWLVGWTIGIRHYWDQTFPAGAEMKISHTYKTFPNGGLFYWYDWTKPTKDWDTDPNADDKKKYCIDDATGEAIKETLPADADGNRPGSIYNIQYVLTTAHTWKGPIGKFKLTLDKGDAKNTLSVCFDGIAKSGPTTFTAEKDNYTPEKDLEIMVVTAGRGYKEE